MIFIYKTNHLYDSGSVSVFFAIIMVVLITFLFTIFDFSRLQFIQLEASSNFETAAEIALSQYEPLLFHQYGLFAGHQGVEVESVFKECLETQFYPDQAQKNTYLLDYFLSDQSKLPKLSMMEPEGYEFELKYEPFISHDYNFPREQILDFMKLREPYLLLKPFLLNLDILSKSSRSSSVIEEKNELVSTFNAIESYKLQLYKLIDGVEIYSNGDWSLLDSSDYVRKFTYKNELNYSYFPIGEDYKLKEPLMNYSILIKPLVPILTDVDVELKKLLSRDPFVFLYTKDDDPILIGVLENDVTKEVFITLELLNSKFNEFELLDGTITNQLKCNTEALQVLTELETLCKSNISEIESYQLRLANKDNVIESVRSQMNKEMDVLKSEMAISGIRFNETDNLPLIKSQLESNVVCLSQSLTYIESLTATLEDYIYRRYLSLKSKATINEEQLQLLDHKMLRFLSDKDLENSPVEQSTVLILLKFFDNFISQYKSDLLFDYRKLNISRPEENDYEDKQKGLLNFDLLNVFKDNDLLKFYPGLNIEEEFLPSHLVTPGLLSVVDFSMMDRGIEGNSTRESINVLDIDALLKLASDLHDTILINEYAVGMFSNVSKSNNPNSKTLNGFKVDEHFLKYETEYILAGHIDEQKNMDKVLSYLYGTRMPLNLLHLAIEPTKRATIMNIATTIAGWWTGGVGAIIIAIVIAGFWALLESVADVFLLVSGERVPIIKTRSSWYTSLDGNVLELFDKGVRRIENDFIIYMEETTQLIDAGFEGIHHIIEQNKNSTSNEDYKLVISYVEELKEKLVDFGEEVGFGIETFDMEFDIKLHEYIDEELEMTLTKGSNHNVFNPFEEVDSKWLSSNILQKIYLVYYNLPSIDRNLDELIRVKKEVFEQYAYQIKKYKESYKTQVSDLYGEVINYQMAVLEEGVSELMKNGTKIGRKLIVDKADEIKDEFLSDIETTVADKSGVEAFIPSFTYEDYLRLFLLLPIVDEKTKIARMMDLLQLNTQKIYDNYEMNLADYYVGVNVKGTVKAKTLFIPNIDQYKVEKLWELEVYHVSKYY